MKRINLTALIAIVILAFAFTACAPKAEATPSTETSLPTYALISEGQLVPVDTLDHYFNIPGQIAEVLVQDGEQVEAGQALARLVETPDVALAIARAEQEVLAAEQAIEALETSAELNLANSRLALIQAQQAVEDAQTQLEDDETDENQALLDFAKVKMDLAKQTLEKFSDGKGIDSDLMAAAQARLASAQASVINAQAAQDDFVLKADMAGTVVDLFLKVGQKVAFGSLAVTLADYSSWLVKTDNLTETDVVNVSLGQKVEITLDALPEVTLNGEVTNINARYEEKRGDITYTVTIQLNQADPRMRWGMTAAVSFLP